MTSIYEDNDILKPDDPATKIRLGSSLGKFKGSELRVVNLKHLGKETVATVAVFLIGYRTHDEFDIDIQGLKNVSAVKFRAFNTARKLRLV